MLAGHIHLTPRDRHAIDWLEKLTPYARQLLQSGTQSELPIRASLDRSLLSNVRRAIDGERLIGRDALRLRLPSSTWIDVEAAAEAIHDAESAVALGEWQRGWIAAHIRKQRAERLVCSGRWRLAPECGDELAASNRAAPFEHEKREQRAGLRAAQVIAALAAFEHNRALAAELDSIRRSVHAWAGYRPAPAPTSCQRPADSGRGQWRACR